MLKLSTSWANNSCFSFSTSPLALDLSMLKSLYAFGGEFWNNKLPTFNGWQQESCGGWHRMSVFIFKMC